MDVERARAFFDAISDWRSSTIFTTRERLVLEFAERFSSSPDELGYDSEYWARMRDAFSSEEIYSLTVAVASWTASARTKHVLGFDQVCVG